MLQAVQASHEAIGVRHGFAARNHRRRLSDDAAAIDDLQEAAVRDDGHAVRVEDREEGLVRLFQGHRFGEDDGGFDLTNLGAVDEALTGQSADVIDELGQIRVLQIELDQVAPRLRAKGTSAAVAILSIGR